MRDVKRRAGFVLIVVGSLVSLATGTAQAQPVLSAEENAMVLERADAAGSVTSMEAASGSAPAVTSAFAPELEHEEAQTIKPAALSATAPLDLVLLHGSFKDLTAKIPRGAKVPKGKFMAFVVDPATGRIAATYVGNEALAMPGTVERQDETEVNRVVPPAKGARLRAHASRLMAHAATWGEGCKRKTGSHCYVVSEWNMAGAEEVLGTQSEQITYSANVPGWSEGSFVTNEEWAWAHRLGPETWTEIGQQVGEYKSCCTAWWFYAFGNGQTPGGYRQFVDEPYVWQIQNNVWTKYMMQTNGGGAWCWYTGSSFNERHFCESDFAWQATELEAGAEVATEAKPTFAAAVNDNAEWTNGTWHVWNKDHFVATSTGLCEARYPGGAAGDISYETC